jgi:protein-S-isoprenylcysteine O-methyltransferase Ste14
MWRRLNDLAIFDAARWPAREVVGRILGCLMGLAFITRRFLQLPSSPGYIDEVAWARPWFDDLSRRLPEFLVAKPVDLEIYRTYFQYTREEIRILWGLQALLWLVITGSFIAYLLAYLTRKPAQSVAKGFMQTVFPLAIAFLPFAVVMTKFTYADWFPPSSKWHLKGLYAVTLVILVGHVVQLIALLQLRRSFTIMSEARVLIRSGIYRWIRHPIYAAHFVVNFCYTLLYFGLVNVALYITFVAGQTLRARIEERKLAAAFPEYEEYRKTTGMFFPKLFR